MSFSIKKGNAKSRVIYSENIPDIPPNYRDILEAEMQANPTIHDRIPFPGIRYDVLDNIKNFSISYYKNSNNDEEVKLDASKYNFDDGFGITTNKYPDAPLYWLAAGATGNNGNNSIIRFFPKCFDIAAEFSIKIETGSTLTELLCFEYNPKDASVLEEFSRAIGGNGTFIHTGGNINCIISKYDKCNILEPRVLGCILDPANTLNADEPLQYCGKISLDFSRLTADEVEITSMTGNELAKYKLKIPILLKISVYITYMFL